MVYAERMAHDLRLPLVRLVDGTGGGGSVKRSRRWASPTCRSCPGWELVVANLSRGAGGRRGARPGRRARRGARRRVALLGDRARHRAALRGRARRSWRAAMGETPDKEELGGARAQTARRRGRQRGGRRGRRARPAPALPLLPAAERVGAAAGRAAPTTRRPPRGGAALDRPARPAQAVQGAPHPRAGLRPRLGLRDRPRATAARWSPRSRGSTAGRSACSPPTRTTTAAG